MSEKSSENSEMSELAFASTQLQTNIAPPALSSHIGERIRAAARRLGWSHSRTKDIWYEDERVSLKPRELRQIEEITGVRYGREELAEIDALITRADTLLASRGEDFNSPVVAALRALLGAVDRTGAGR